MLICGNKGLYAFESHNSCSYCLMLGRRLMTAWKVVPNIKVHSTNLTFDLQVDRRAALRDTWAREGLVRGRRVKLIFLLGRSVDIREDNNTQDMLRSESLHYGDILQWDFADTFFNLTLKEVGFLRWFSESCSHSNGGGSGGPQFVFKGDDDVFVNTANLIRFLKGRNPDVHLFTGDIIPYARPIRNRHKKYFISWYIYGDNPYPPYAGGGGYLMSRTTVFGLNEAAKSTELFPIDDVYTGFCLKKMGVRPRRHPGFLTFGFRRGPKQRLNPCAYRGIMLVHKLNPVELRAMWPQVNNGTIRC